MSQNTSQINTGSAMASSPVYPGYVLKVGSSGSSVAIMQSYLNAIKQGMYPSLTHLAVDGKYGNGTKNTVMQYQNLSGLKADGTFVIGEYDLLQEISVGLVQACGGRGVIRSPRPSARAVPPRTQ